MSGTWETIRGVMGGTASGVTVAWRSNGPDQNVGLVVSIRGDLLERIGATRGKRAQRVVVQRNRSTHRLRISLAAPGTAWCSTRGLKWKEGRGLIQVPLPDIELAERKPAQDTLYVVSEKHIEVKLPPWAATGFVKVAA